MLEELVALEAEAGPSFTAQSLTAGHAKQLRAVLDTSRFIILLCSRRAGKTAAIIFRLLLRCTRVRSNCVYIALTKDQARSIIWEPALGIGWKRLLQGIYGDASLHWHNEVRMTTTFPNGSVVHFTGCSDVRKLETELGAGVDEAIIDESQSSPASVLGPLVYRVLQNSLMDRRGTLVLSGTVPDVDGGVFMDIWKESNWSKHNWSQMDNPHMPHARSELDEFLSMNPGLTINSPIIQRERFGNFVWDKDATAYMYDHELNGYAPTLLPWADETMGSGIVLPMTEDAPEGRVFVPSGLMMAAAPLPWVEWISFAIDPASDSDRISIQGLGWGRESKRIQHLFDWTSDPGKRHSTSEMFAVAGLARRKYGGGTGRRILPFKYDASSAKMVVDNLMRDFGIPVVLPASKGGLKDGVDRVNTALTDGRLMLMRGSCWVEDCQKARRDPTAWARGKFAWASTWHPDASEAGRYALEHYFDAYKEPPKVEAPKTPYEEFQAREAAKAQNVTRRGWKPGQRGGRNRGAFGG
jgi:hypothetical protein